MFVELSTLIGAVAVFISSVTGLLLAIHSVRNEVKAVHTIVNSRTEDQIARIEQLSQVIANAIPEVELPASPTREEEV